MQTSSTPPVAESELEPVLSAAAMRAADAYTIDTFGIPGFTLMESAGRAAVDAARRRYGPVAGKRILILCGKGNNGGDGLVVARGFLASGATVHVVTLSRPAEMSGDARHNYGLLAGLQPHLREDQLVLMDRVDDLITQAPSYDLCVDALLGTGVSSPLRPPISTLVAWLNAQSAPVLSVDIPTGLHADHGTVSGEAVVADMTVTMGALKTGLLLNEGPAYAGFVHVAEIGIPQHALHSRITEPSSGARAADAYVSTRLPSRGPTAHKYSVGMTLAIAGSPGLTGAPVLSATAAARIGSGAVVVATHEEVQHTLAAHFTEVMTLALPATSRGDLDLDPSMEVLGPRLAQASALLIGCGLGRSEATANLVRRVCSETNLPLVLDADGLNALAEHTHLFSEHAQGRWVLTPHAGEFRRLAGDVDLTDRLEVVREYARTWNCVLLLKGMPSVIGSPDGKVFVCKTGNPALATAGTGDVLAGFVAGLLAQGLSPLDAAVCGAHIGGQAADYYVRHRSGRTMQAMDLVRLLPRVLRDRFEKNN